MLRKTRLPTACALAGVLAIVVLAGAQAKRATGGANRFALNLDGSTTALVSFNGGGVFADVVSDAGGDKQPGPPRVEEIVLGLPVTAPAAQQLASAMLKGDSTGKSGSIVSFNATGSAVSELQFNDATITEFSLPTLDGASKEQGYITIKLAPEQVTTSSGGGSKSSSAADKSMDKWMPAYFRLDIDGIDCSKVSRIESIGARRGSQSSSAGAERVARKQSGALEVANLRVSFPASSASMLHQWFDQLVVKGQSDQEKHGTLKLMSPDLKTELLVIQLHNLGIVRVSPESSDTSAEKPGRVVAELYCERLELVPGKS